MPEKAARTHTLNQNAMLKVIEISTSTGNELQVHELLEDCVIDFFKQNEAVELLPQRIKWRSMLSNSPPEIVEKASWSWNSQQKGNGAVGNCTIYIKSDKQVRSKTSEKIIRDDAVYTIESITSS